MHFPRTEDGGDQAGDLTWNSVSCRFPILNPFQGLQKDQTAERKTFLSQNIWLCFGFQKGMLAGLPVCLQLSGLLLGSVPTPACRTTAVSSKLPFPSSFALWLGLTCDRGKNLKIQSEKVRDIRVISPHLSRLSLYGILSLSLPLRNTGVQGHFLPSS